MSTVPSAPEPAMNDEVPLIKQFLGGANDENLIDMPRIQQGLYDV